MKKKELMQWKIMRQQKLLDDAKAAHRELTAEESAEFNNLQREIEDLKREIKEEESAGGERSMERTNADEPGQNAREQVDAEVREAKQ